MIFNIKRAHRDGIILNLVSDEVGDHRIVQALVPLSTMIGYAKAVRSLTAGR